MRLNVSRQACGAINGSNPSTINIMPTAIISVEPNYLPPEPRMYLKNSELGSNTNTSDLFLKLFL